MIALWINIILVTINGFYSIAKKRENKILLFISMIVLFLLMAGYRGSYAAFGLSRDMYNYSRLYDKIKTGVEIGFVEPGYQVLCLLTTRVLKMNFLTFYAIIMLLSLIAISQICKKAGSNRHVFIALFASFLHIYSCEQFQNYIALIIATIALEYLIFSEKEGINYKYMIGVLIATLFHYTMIVYMVFIFLNVKNRRLLIKGIAISSVALCLFEMITGSRINLNAFLSIFSSVNEAASRYYTISHFGWLYGAFFQLSIIFISFLNIRQFHKMQSIDESKKEMILKNLNGVFWINIIGVIFFPLYMINTQLIRLGRGLLLINYVGCAQILPFMNLKKKNVYMLLYLLWCIVYAYLYIVLSTGGGNSVFWPFFKMNAFFAG